MYSEHNWDAFIDDYFEDRDSVLSQIKNKKIPRTTPVQKLLSVSDLGNTDISQLIDIILNNSFNNSFLYTFISFLLRKFEVKKNILINYSTNLKEINTSDYIKLSYLLSKYLENDFNVKFLNFLLKLNDRIILRHKFWVETEDEPYFYHSVSLEKIFVQQLMEKAHEKTR